MIVTADVLAIVCEHPARLVAVDGRSLVGRGAFFDTSTILQHFKKESDIEVGDESGSVELGRLGPVQIRIVLRLFTVAATILIRVPAEDEQLRVTLLPSVGGSAAETDDGRDENQAADAICDATL